MLTAVFIGLLVYIPIVGGPGINSDATLLETRYPIKVPLIWQVAKRSRILKPLPETRCIPAVASDDIDACEPQVLESLKCFHEGLECLDALYLKYIGTRVVSRFSWEGHVDEHVFKMIGEIFAKVVHVPHDSIDFISTIWTSKSGNRDLNLDMVFDPEFLALGGFHVLDGCRYFVFAGGEFLGVDVFIFAVRNRVDKAIRIANYTCRRDNHVLFGLIGPVVEFRGPESWGWKGTNSHLGGIDCL